MSPQEEAFDISWFESISSGHKHEHMARMYSGKESIMEGHEWSVATFLAIFWLFWWE